MLFDLVHGYSKHFVDAFSVEELLDLETGESPGVLSSVSVSSERSWAMYVPRYLNLFVNFMNLFPGITNLPFTNSSSISFIGLKWEGKYMTPVLDFEFGVLVHPRCTSRPNWAKVCWTRMVPAIRSAFDRKMKAEFSAYSAALWCNGAPFLVRCLFKKPSDSEGKYLRSGV